jgi:hypothetical protein
MVTSMITADGTFDTSMVTSMITADGTFDTSMVTSMITRLLDVPSALAAVVWTGLVGSALTTTGLTLALGKVSSTEVRALS